MDDVETTDIFLNELNNCLRFDDFLELGSNYFDLPKPNLCDIYALMSHYERIEDRETYVEKHCFRNNVIKQQMILHWFDTVHKAHQLQSSLFQ